METEARRNQTSGTTENELTSTGNEAILAKSLQSNDLSDLAKDDAITGSTENYVNEQANNVFDLLLKEFSENNTDTTESLKNSLESELEDALSTDADEAMIDDIVNSLKVKGFENIDDLPYETLEVLINRAEVFDENGKSITLCAAPAAGCCALPEHGSLYTDASRVFPGL